jgi:hypothetical protein
LRDIKPEPENAGIVGKIRSIQKLIGECFTEVKSSRAYIWGNLTCLERIAYNEYHIASGLSGRSLSDREAYNFLIANKTREATLDTEGDFNSWEEDLLFARKALGEL